MRPVTVQIGRTLSSICTRMRTVAAPGPTRYVIGRPPCHCGGASGPLQRVEDHARVAPRERRADDLRQRHGLAARIRFAPGTDAQPGVSGSPGTRKS